MDSRAVTLRRPFRRRLAAAALAALIAVAVAWGAGSLRLVRLLHLKTGDAHALLSPARSPRSIVLLVVDQSSLDTFPEPLLFWHERYAQAIEAAAAGGARVLGLDVAFAIPVTQWAPSLDQRLTEAVVNASRVMPVVCVTNPAARATERDWPVPVNVAAAALSQLADPSLRADEDDFVRSVDLRSPESIPGFALLVAEKSGLSVHMPAGSPMRIRYAGPAGAFERVPLYRFLDAARRNNMDQLRRWVGGRIVLLGADILSDRHPTPYYAFRAGQPANTAGVEIHASAVWNLLEGNSLRPASHGWTLVFMAVAALLGAITGMLHGPLRIAISAFVVVGLAMAACQYLYESGWTLPASAPLLAWAVALPLGMIWARRDDAHTRARLHAAVSAYAAPEVAHSAMEHGVAKLPGSRVQAAILFTDIRNFTRYSNSVAPEVVFARLNDYFTASAAVVAAHGGRIVQLVGDGMLAIFPADARDSGGADHAVRAVRAALQIVADTTLFVTGAGVHAGEVVVGGVGSGEKMEYTALGDAVNVAARLESLNKECGASLLLSDDARRLLGEALPVKLIGSFLLRGKAAPQDVFTIVRDA